jgi:hypothetical protein
MAKKKPGANTLDAKARKQAKEDLDTVVRVLRESERLIEEAKAERRAAPPRPVKTPKKSKS